MRMALALLLLLGLQQPGPPPGSPAGPTMADAQARLAANDSAGAAKILDAIVATTPASVPAWTLLGTTRRQMQDYDGAIAA